MLYCLWFDDAVRRCPAIFSPMNGVLTCDAANLYGSRCSVACIPGYSVDGQPAQTECLSDRQWSNDVPDCRRKSTTVDRAVTYSFMLLSAFFCAFQGALAALPFGLFTSLLARYAANIQNYKATQFGRATSSSCSESIRAS